MAETEYYIMDIITILPHLITLSSVKSFWNIGLFKELEILSSLRNDGVKIYGCSYDDLEVQELNNVKTVIYKDKVLGTFV